MNRFRLQHLRRVVPPTPSPPPPPGAANLWPATGFNAIDDASGFGANDPFVSLTGPVSQPTPSAFRTQTDPPRPTLTYAEDEREVFTSDLAITVFSYAIGGVAKVRGICNGNFADVLTMTARTRKGRTNADFEGISWDGNDHPSWGYQFNLKHANFDVDGWARLYFISWANDPLMLPRVIGPILVKRKTGAHYDATLLFGAGQPYADTNAAINAAGTMCKSVAAGGSGYEHIRLQPVGAITYDTTTAAPSFVAYTNKGQVDIVADSGNTWLLNKATDGAVAQFGFDFEGMRWGPGCRLDYAAFSTLYAAYTPANNRRAFTLMGAEVFDSHGKYDLTGWYGHAAEKDPRQDGGISGSTGGWRCMEVNWHDMPIGPKYTKLIRNTTVTDSTQDQLNQTDKNTHALPWTHIENVKVIGFTLAYWDLEINAIHFTFSDGSDTLTIEPDAGQIGHRQYIFKRNGSVVANIPLVDNNLGTSDGTTFTPDGPGSHDVSAWVTALNAKAGSDGAGVGLHGLVATTLDNTRRAGYLGQKTWTTPISITAGGVNLVTVFDIHGDLSQDASGETENVNVINLRAPHCAGQAFHVDGSGVCDRAWINCFVSYDIPQQGYSHAQGHNSHQSFVHLTMINQTIDFLTNQSSLSPSDQAKYNFTADAWCEYGGCILSGGAVVNAIQYASSPVRDDLKIRDNFITTGALPGGAGVSNNFTGTAYSALLVDALNNDPTPKGLAVSTKVLARVPFDINGLARGATTSAGCAVAAAGG